MRAQRCGLTWKPNNLLRSCVRCAPDPDLSETPFIVVTPESKTENLIAAGKAGVNNHMAKPFNAQTPRAKIEAMLARKDRDETIRRGRVITNRTSPG
jgi:two-component system, chemotaxis family, chemotaxis protein CheY